MKKLVIKECKMKPVKLLIAMTVTLASSVTSAEELVTFQAGQVAKAADINANFQALANAHNPTIYNILSDGNIIGHVAYAQNGPNYIYPTQINCRSVSIGYIGKDGHLRSYGNIYFKSEDCSGQGYLRIADGSSDLDKFIFPSTQLHLTDFNDSLYYIDGYNQALQFNAGSELSRATSGRGHNCRVKTSYQDGYYVPWQANNSNITGIVTYPFPTPITLQGHNEIPIIQQ